MMTGRSLNGQSLFEFEGSSPISGPSGSGRQQGIRSMCRNIRTLFNFAPPATEEEIQASALQFVRKLSGYTAPSKANEAAFLSAVDEVSTAARKLLGALKTSNP